jgi:hypothetical protein
MNNVKTVGFMMIAIIATGIVLKLCGDGLFGDTVKKAAQTVTKGYGV